MYGRVYVGGGGWYVGGGVGSGVGVRGGMGFGDVKCA